MHMRCARGAAKPRPVLTRASAAPAQEIFFNFSAPFEIHDDSETLKRMGMQRCTADRLEALVPPNLVAFARESELVDPAPSASGARSSGGRR